MSEEVEPKGVPATQELAAAAVVLRRSIQEPIAELEDAITALERVADYLLLGDADMAREALRSIEHDPLMAYWKAKEISTHGLTPVPAVGKRGRLKESIHRLVLERDGWRCRYCGVRVVDRDARRRLIKMMGDPPIWGRRDCERHPVLLVLSGVADHVVPATSIVDHAEADDTNNLVASCWACNFGKMNFSCETLGLEDPRKRPPLHDDWDGLRRLLNMNRPHR